MTIRAFACVLSAVVLLCHSAAFAQGNAKQADEKGERLNEFLAIGCWQKNDAIAILEAHKQHGAEEARTRIFESFVQNKCGIGKISGVAIREVYRADKLLIGNMYEEGYVYEFLFDTHGADTDAGRILYILLFRPET